MVVHFSPWPTAPDWGNNITPVLGNKNRNKMGFCDLDCQHQSANVLK